MYILYVVNDTRLLDLSSWLIRNHAQGVGSYQRNVRRSMNAREIKTVLFGKFVILDVIVLSVQLNGIIFN